MASHHSIVTIRPRNLANVLADLKEARRDEDAAKLAVLDGEDAEDRVTEAETRCEDLQDELAERFREATGLTVEQFRDAFAEALI